MHPKRLRPVLITAAVFLLVVATPAWYAQAAVTTTAAGWTPQMIAPAQTGYVRQLVPCGPNMYAVGTFSQFRSPADGNRSFTRNNAIAFSGTTGKVTAFNPSTNGIVNSIALDPADCSTAWIGGQFTSVGGQPATNIAAVDTATGALRSGFRHSANGQVSALLHTHGRVLAAGYFSTVNGASRAKLASLDPVTGNPDGYLSLGLTGSYPGGNNATRGYNFTLSHSGDQLLLTGVFTAAGGTHREQVLQLDLGANSATLNGWTSADFSIHCANSLPFYLQDAAYSPDDSQIYIATTGFKAPGDRLRTGVCDAAAAYPNTAAQVSRQWANFTGCDSLYTVVADSTTVYVGGHQRWLNNENACDSAGAGALAGPGIGGLSPSTGRATSWNPTRSRGAGADDLVIAFNGLWVASDNKNGATQCAGAFHPGICFLPY